MSRREQLQELLKADPDDPFLHYAIAKEYLSEGEAEEGIQRLSVVIERFPDYVAAYFQQGQAYAEQGETESASDVITRGIQVAGRVGDAHAKMEMEGFLDMLE